MSQIQISLAEKPILNYLRDGGDLNSDKCVILVADFIKKVLRDEDVRNAAIQCGLSPEELFFVFMAMQEAKPHSCLDVGGPLLIPTLVFMEPFRLESIGRLANKYEQDGQRRSSAIIQASTEIADVIFATHQAAQKTMCFVHLRQKIKNANSGIEKGCGCLLAVAITIGMAILLKSFK